MLCTSFVCFLVICFLVAVVGRYNLRDIVVGKIYFLLVRIKIKHMEIAIIKKETSGTRGFTFRQCRGSKA